ncbi:MAG: DUF4351 domain-containing protein [Hormoscilla sp.]
MSFESFEMMVFRECPLGQEILQEGRYEGAQQMLRRLLQHRFGEGSESIHANLQCLSLEELKTLAEKLFEVNSLEELKGYIYAIED